MNRWLRMRMGLPAAIFALATGCATMGETTDDYDDWSFSSGDSRAELPGGFGTLRQDDVTLSLRDDALLIKVTPMAHSITRLTAPDTQERLEGLGRAHRDNIEARTGVREPMLFFVSVFSNEPNVSFEPEDLSLTNRGLRFRPLSIQPVTPDWGAQRLEQRQTRSAVYAFESGIDLEADLQVEYRNVQNNSWGRLIPMLRAESAKVRARAGTEGESGVRD